MVHAPSLHGAVEHLAAAPFDVILLDLRLGDATGLQALQTLIAEAPDTPVIVLSGDDSLALAARAVQAGAQDYLPKNGVTGDSLTRAILYAIERKRSERQTKSLALRDSLTRLPKQYCCASTCMSRWNGRNAPAARSASFSSISTTSNRSTIRWVTPRETRSCNRWPAGSRRRCGRATPSRG